MRIGAIFARGSCRALKWMALFGVVFALGAGSAAAQVTVTVDDTVGEGDVVTLTVGGTVTVAPAAASPANLTVTASVVAYDGDLPTGVTAGELSGAGDDTGTRTTLTIQIPAHSGGMTDDTVPVSGTFIWQVSIDDDAEDEGVALDYDVQTPTGVTTADPANKNVTIEDAQTQTFVWGPAELPTVKEGDSATDTPATAPDNFTLTAVPEPVQLTYATTITSRGTLGYDVTGTGVDVVTFAAGTASATVGITAPGNDQNRTDDEITLHADVTGGTNPDPLSIMVEDIHKLPMLDAVLVDSAGDEVAGAMAMEGSDYTVRVYPVDADGDRIAASEEWTVTLTTGGSTATSADYTLGDSVTIAMQADADMAQGEAALSVESDNDLDSNETVMISYTVMGEPTNGTARSAETALLTVTITDGTMPQVTANSEAVVQGIVDGAMPQAEPHGFNPNDSISFSPVGMFTASDGYELSYEVSSDDPATVAAGVANGSNAMVRLDAMAVGSAMITVTARARMMASSATIPTQTQADWAQVMFDATVVSGQQVPGMPTSLMASDGDDGQVTLTWAAPTTGGAVDSYEFTYGIGTAREPWAAATSPTTVTGLTNGTEYTFEVRAMNAAGAGEAATAMATPMAPTMAPDAPVGLGATVGDKQVTLTWSAPTTGAPPTWYQYRASTGGVAGEWMRTSSDTTQTVTGLTNGTEYTFEVRGVNDGGPGDAASVTATPMAPVEPVAPSAPQSLTATAGDAQVTLTWTAPASGDTPTGYQYRRMAGGLSSDWMATSSDTTQTVTGLTNGTEYTFEVRAMNAAGTGPAASATATPMAPAEPVAPSAPQNLAAAGGDAQVTLTWTAPASGDTPTGYQYRVTGAGVSGQWMATSSATTQTVTGLTNGTEYTFEVRAMNAAGNGPPAMVKATPMVPDPGVQVTVKEVKANTSVAESGGLEVTVVATVPAGTKVDGKVAPIASRAVMVSFSTAEIMANERAELGQDGDVRVLTSPTVWNNITRTDKDSEQEYKFRLAIGQDLDAEDEKFQVSVSIDGAAKMSKVITIDDAQDQEFELSLPSSAKGKIKEGSSGTLTLKAVPAKTFDIPVTLALSPNDPSKYTLSSPSSSTFGVGSVTASVTAKADGDRTEDRITVSAYTSGTLGNDVKIAEVDITIEDVNALPAVKATFVDDKGMALSPQPESAMEGDTVKVMLTVVDKDGKAMKAAEKLSVSLSPTSGSAADYRLSSHPITIDSGKESSASVDLMLEMDDDIGMEMLVFSASVAGDSKVGPGTRTVANLLSIAVEDGTQKLVWPKSPAEVEAVISAAMSAGTGDGMFNPGEMIEIMGGALFNAAEGVSLSYTAGSDSSAVATVGVSSGTVTVTAVAEGMANITITAHAGQSSGATIGNQTDPRVASVMFPVTVGNTALEVTLSTDPMDMVEEGGTITVTAMANRNILADEEAMITLTVTGAVEMPKVMLEIPSGMDTGTAVIEVMDDMEVMPLADITIVAMGSGLAEPMTFTLSVTENDSPRTFTLSAPDDMMNLVEGGDGVELTVTADPAVSVDTEVMIMVDRAASTAGADDFTAAAVMISAGETSGTTMLMATEDGIDDSGHGSPEMLVVFAMADNTQSNTVSFYIWDMAVPALPLIAQLLLAAFLAIGGYRRYLRR